MTINGEQMSPDRLISLLNDFIAKLLESPEDLLGTATFFEVTTALAWLHFANNRVDYAIFEVGLGGRLDCTNLCSPLVTAITRIGRDHVKVLGEEISQIAAEKAGIIKPYVPVVNAAYSREARDVVSKTARENGSPEWQLGRDVRIDVTQFWSEEAPVSRFSVTTPCHHFPDMELTVCGVHQIDNAATALSMISQLLQTDESISLSNEQIREALSTCRLPMRIEKISLKPMIVLDVAHNGPSAEALVKTLRGMHVGRKYLLVACSRDKEIAEILAPMSKYFDDITVTRYIENPRAADPQDLADIFSTLEAQAKVRISQTPIDAIQTLMGEVGPEDLICISGSFFLAAEMRKYLTARI